MDTSREGLERLWRSRLQDAQLRLEFARIYVKEVQRDFPLHDSNADGHFAHGYRRGTALAWRDPPNPWLIISMRELFRKAERPVFVQPSSS